MLENAFEFKFTCTAPQGNTWQEPRRLCKSFWHIKVYCSYMITLSLVHLHLLPLVQPLLRLLSSHCIPFIQSLPALCTSVSSHPIQKQCFSSLLFVIISQVPSTTQTPPSTRGLRTSCPAGSDALLQSAQPESARSLVDLSWRLSLRHSLLLNKSLHLIFTCWSFFLLN